MKIKKVDIFLIVIGLFLVFLTILFSFYPHLGDAFDLSAYSDPDTVSYNIWTGLLIVVISCFLGALLPFPVPYTIIVGIVALQYIQSGYGWGAVIVMILAATLSNVIGDMIDWLLGRGGGYLAEKDQESVEKTEEKSNGGEQLSQTDRSAKESTKKSQDGETTNKWARLVFERPVLIPILLIIFGLTPLPDSLLFVPLGVINYSAVKTFIWNGLGKLLMMTAVALLGVFTFDLLFSLLGGGTEGGWVSGMVVLFLSWLLMVAMTRD